MNTSTPIDRTYEESRGVRGWTRGTLYMYAC